MMVMMELIRQDRVVVSCGVAMRGSGSPHLSSLPQEASRVDVCLQGRLTILLALMSSIRRGLGDR